MNKRRVAVLVVLMALTLAADAAAEFEVGDVLRIDTREGGEYLGRA